MADSDATRAADRLRKEEFQQLEQAFKKFDKDGSGSIDFKELGFLLRSLGQNPTKPELHNIRNLADADGSGCIDLQEFVGLMSHSAREQAIEARETLRHALKLFDKDGSGYVSATELRYVMTNLGDRMSEEEVEELLSFGHIDSSNLMNYEEFLISLIPLPPEPEEDPSKKGKR
ncbi:calmodulin-like [Branchiostoma lanceolatum]|uniref:CALM1 protein n=1 Tax=Branchiostoma lanceolatum TaxID=7740 RepID=A0A8J9ZHU9_BRALA|nr:CALM1 [Branchiostoma lanceolatum]